MSPEVIPTLFEVLTLQGGYNSALVIIGTTLLGLAAGIIGTYVTLRKRALMSDALAHSGLPGLCVAFILGTYVFGSGRSVPLLLLGAAISGAIGVATVQFLVSHTRLREDAAIGVVLSVFFGFGIVLLSFIQHMGTGEEGGLHHFIYGQTAAMQASDIYLLTALTLITLFSAFILFKEFRLISFDPGYAAAQGWPVQKLDLIMMFLVVIVTVVGFRSVGLILVIALLIIPGVAARFWSDKMTLVLVGGGLIGASSGYIGSVISSTNPHMPAGAIIVLTAGAFFLFSFLFAPKRGFLINLVYRLQDNYRFRKQLLAENMASGSGND